MGKEVKAKLDCGLLTGLKVTDVMFPLAFFLYFNILLAPVMCQVHCKELVNTKIRHNLLVNLKYVHISTA